MRFHLKSRTPVRAWCAAAVLLASAPAFAAEQGSGTTKRPFEVTVYPILVEAPIFGATIDLPALPSGGGGDESGEQSGSTNLSLDSAYMAGFAIRADRWFGEMRGMWAAVGASRASPRVRLDSDAKVVNARGGVRLVGGFSATAGFRRIDVDLDATLGLPVIGKEISGRTSAVYWDPLVGVDWREHVGRWVFDANFQGGGFGVGADSDVSAELHANWRLIPHTEFRFGYTFLYYKLTVANVSIGSFQRELVSSQTLHGPIIGFGLLF